MLDEADTRGKLSQALSLLAQYEERIQIVTRQMHAQESLLTETQSRMQQGSAELESCRAQLSAALQRPPQRSISIQTMQSNTPVAIQTDRWMESNSTILPMPQQPPLPQSPPVQVMSASTLLPSRAQLQTVFYSEVSEIPLLRSRQKLASPLLLPPLRFSA